MGPTQLASAASGDLASGFGPRGASCRFRLTRLARLRREVDVDLAALDARAGETRELLGKAALSRAELVLLAVNLHAYYTGLETLLERVARLLDDELPTGSGWHAELIEQMRTEVPGLRPALIPDATVVDLHELRKFTHFFRNAYVLELDPGKVDELARRLDRVHVLLAQLLPAFQAHLTALLGAP